jgi:hypothetical protein
MGTSRVEDQESFYQLNLLIKRKSMHCAISDEKKSIVWFKEFVFPEDIENNAESRESFHAIFQKESIFFKDFKNVVLAYHSPRSTIVEKDGLEALNSLEDAIALLLKRYPTDHLLSTVLNNSQWVHVTFLPKSVQLELNIHFPEAKHTSLVATLHNYFTQLNYLGDNFFITLEDDQFTIHYYRDNLLSFVKCFPMFYHEDLIYHITSIVEGFALSSSTTVLHLLGKSSYSNSDLLTKLQEFFPNTHVLTPATHKSFSNANLQALNTLIQCA